MNLKLNHKSLETKTCTCSQNEPKLNYDYDPMVFWGQEPSPKELSAGSFVIQGIKTKELANMVDTLISAGIKSFRVGQMKTNEWDIHYDE